MMPGRRKARFLLSSGLRTPSGLSLPSPLPLQTAMTITAVSGPHDGEVWRLSQPHVTIGRTRMNDICLHNDPGVSRGHFTMRYNEGQWYLRDEGSSNGTFLCLAGQLCRITRSFELPGNARIRVGSTELKISFGS